MPNAIAAMLKRYPDLMVCEPDLLRAVTLLRHCFQSGGQLLICGNGGSASDSQHIVGELMKGFVQRRPIPASVREEFYHAYGEEGEKIADFLQEAFPVISLTVHTALTSAVANDTHADMIYAQQVYGYGHQGDALLAISTSGNSQNVVKAVQVARVKGLYTIGLSGQGGGQLAQWCDVIIRVPYTSTFLVQECHLPIYHAICMALEEVFFVDDNTCGD